MPDVTNAPLALGGRPFRASKVIAAGRITARMLRGRAWRRLFFDVYISSASFDADNHRMWCEAAGLIMPRGACIGGWSSAQLWGAPLLPTDAPVWVSVPLNARMRPANRLRIQRTPLPPADIDRSFGFPVTTSVRTAFDLGRYLPRTDALVALDALCNCLVKPSELEAYATARWSWPRTRQLRSLLPMIEPRTESPMETRVRLLVVDGGLPAPDAQVEVRTEQGVFIGRVDLAYQEWKIAIEYEGDHHRERRQYQQDVARVNALRENGWLVLRFTADDVLRHPERLVRQVARAIADRR